VASNPNIVKDSARRVQRMERLFDLLHQFPGMSIQRSIYHSLQIAIYVCDIVNVSSVKVDSVLFEVVWTWGSKKCMQNVVWKTSWKETIMKTVCCLVHLTL
jgi:hypothetical protein